ncbi:uncharacterized protein LOC101209995 [Cucumis sativus]|uniref:Thiol-disulfide oxidoreductase DCC n=1 Tax=Cucumis sativus TaxID=3659 RepID=A0A0A0KVQ2_CUCSA|nr:uncharacterized protein LOC101209995 [Cucumis sativus]KGN51836.1 hypothetical protein Csa_008706 [Cucumis sativus]
MASKLLSNRFRQLVLTSTATIRPTSFTTSFSFSSFRRVFSSKFSSPLSSSFGIDCSTAAPADIADVPEEVVKDYVDVVSPAVAVNSLAAEPVFPTLLQPRVVIYDGVCHLCHRGVKWVIKVDKYKKIKFCCLQSKTAEPYLRLSGLDREDVSHRFVFIEGHGSYHQASTAALRVLSYLPLPYSALSAFLIIPTPLRDSIYDTVARHRYDMFVKAEGCLVLQDEELLERFIDREELLNQRHQE